jgi:hypothetical protein
MNLRLRGLPDRLPVGVDSAAGVPSVVIRKPAPKLAGRLKSSWAGFIKKPPPSGLRQPAELRCITRSHFIPRRKHLESRELAPSSIRRKLSALFDYLCERNAIAGNPVDGVSGQCPTTTKAARRPSLMVKPANCSMGRSTILSRASAIAPFWHPALSASAAKSSAACTAGGQSDV